MLVLGRSLFLPGSLPGGAGDGLITPSGDVTGATDTTVIQAALNASGGMAALGAGQFYTTGLTMSTGNQSLIGQGQGSTILNVVGGTHNGIDSSAGGGSAAITNLRIEHLGIIGPNTGSGIGIKLWTTSVSWPVENAYINDVMVQKMGSHGVDMREVITSKLDSVTSQLNGGKGFYLHANTTSGPSTSVSFIACFANANAAERGYHIDDALYIALTGCAADHNAIGYEISNTASVSLSGCGAEGTTPGTSGLDATQFKVNNSSAVSLSGCYAFQTATGKIAYWVTGNGSATLNCVTETQAISTGTAIQVDLGSSAAVLNQNVTLASTFTGSVNNLSNNGFAEISGEFVLDRFMLVAGNVDITAVGTGLQVAEGSNAKQGTAVLNGTTAVVVANTSVTATSRIFLSIQTPGGTPASPYVFARTAGTSFSIKSTGATDTSTVAYLITEPG